LYHAAGRYDPEGLEVLEELERLKQQEQLERLKQQEKLVCVKSTNRTRATRRASRPGPYYGVRVSAILGRPGRRLVPYRQRPRSAAGRLTWHAGGEGFLLIEVERLVSCLVRAGAFTDLVREMGITGVQVDEIYSLDSDADLEAIK